MCEKKNNSFNLFSVKVLTTNAIVKKLCVSTLIRNICWKQKIVRILFLGLIGQLLKIFDWKHFKLNFFNSLVRCLFPEFWPSPDKKNKTFCERTSTNILKSSHLTSAYILEQKSFLFFVFKDLRSGNLTPCLQKSEKNISI